jgi:hypothetical protein
VHARFLESLRAEGIAVLDMSERFKARGQRFWDVALDLGGHLSPHGHAIAAEELETAIAALPGQSSAAATNPPGDRAPGFNGRTAPRSQ